MLLIPFPLDLKANLLKDIKTETPPGENFTVTYVCKNSSNEKLRILFRDFCYWVKWYISF